MFTDIKTVTQVSVRPLSRLWTQYARGWAVDRRRRRRRSLVYNKFRFIFLMRHYSVLFYLWLFSEWRTRDRSLSGVYCCTCICASVCVMFLLPGRQQYANASRIKCVVKMATQLSSSLQTDCRSCTWWVDTGYTQGTANVIDYPPPPLFSLCLPVLCTHQQEIVEIFIIIWYFPFERRMMRLPHKILCTQKSQLERGRKEEEEKIASSNP